MTPMEYAMERLEQEAIAEAKRKAEEKQEAEKEKLRSEAFEKTRNGARFSKNSVTPLKNLAWAIENGVLSSQDQGALWSAVNRHARGEQLVQFNDGLYMVERGNKIMITDADQDVPSLEAVYEIQSDNGSIISAVKGVFYDEARNGGNSKTAYRIAQLAFEDAGTLEHAPQDYGTHGRYDARGKGSLRGADNQGYSKRKDKGEVRRKSIAAEDAEYMELAKNPVANRAKLDRATAKATDKAGFTQTLYHGTPGLGSTRIDVERSDDGLSFFASDTIEGVTDWYAGTQEQKDVGKNISEAGANNFKFYANIDNLYVINGNGAQWDNITDVVESRDYDDFARYFPEEDGYEIDDMGDYVEVRRGRSSGTYFWDDSNFKYVFGDGVDFSPLRENGFGEGSTRELARRVKESGKYSGVLFKNIYDSGYGSVKADIYCFFYPEKDVKSADPVTYDDEGNVIPLSERFRTDRTGDEEWKNEDIRFSKAAEWNTPGNKVSQSEIDAIQRISKKSVNQFDSSDIAATKRLAEVYWGEMGVKSPFFRAWFGDWRQYDKTPVSAAKKAGETSGVAYNSDTGWDIQYGSRVRSETNAHASQINVDARAYLPYIDDILSKAVLLDTGAVRSKSKSINSCSIENLNSGLF